MCKVKCQISGQCYTLDELRQNNPGVNLQNDLEYAPDGAICTVDGAPGTCDAGECAATPGGGGTTITYGWSYGGWSACSASCKTVGGATPQRTRSISCKTSTGNSADESKCNANSKPDTVSACDPAVANCPTYAWVANPNYNSCSATCGPDGTKTIIDNYICTPPRFPLRACFGYNPNLKNARAPPCLTPVSVLLCRHQDVLRRNQPGVREDPDLRQSRKRGREHEALQPFALQQRGLPHRLVLRQRYMLRQLGLDVLLEAVRLRLEDAGRDVQADPQRCEIGGSQLEMRCELKASGYRDVQHGGVRNLRVGHDLLWGL